MNVPNMPEDLTLDQIIALQARLTDAEETLRAIRHLEVDAIVVTRPEGEQVYSLTSVERIYRDMIETMSESALNVTSDGMILYCNERFARMTKVDLTTVMGSNLLNHFVESDRDAISGLLDGATTGIKRMRAGLRGTDGLVLPVNVATYAWRRDDQPSTIITVITDLTDILAAQASTMTALRYARHLIEAILDPLITIHTDGKITDVNHASRLATGRSSTELVGTDFADYFSEPEKARKFYEQVFAKGYVLDEPLTINNGFGAGTQMLFNASLYREDDGTIGGAVAVGRDVTRHYEDRIQAKHRKRWRTIVQWPLLGVALLGFLLLASSFLSHVDAWTKAQMVSPISMLEAPYLHTGDHRPTTILHAGEAVFYHISTRHSVACFALIQQRILSLVDGGVVHRIIWSNLAVTFGYTKAGNFETNYRFVVPDILPQGDYFLERNTTYDCGGTTLNISRPLLPFTVVK
jgi:PAS domain S-box-containing protein